MSRRGWILFAIASVLWGVPYLLAKLALADFSAPFLVFARAVLGAAILLPIAWHRGALAPLRGQGRRVMWLALLDLSVPTVLITLGVASIPTSLAGTLIASVPLLVAVLAVRYDASERAHGWRLVGLLCGVAGVAMLLGLEVSGDVRALAGGLLVLGGALSYAGATLYYKRHLAQLPPVGVVAAALAGCALITALPAMLTLPAAAPSARGLLSLAGLGLGCTAGGFVAFYSLIGLLGAGRASVITYVAPVVSVGLGVVLLGESITAASVAGLLLVLAGSWLSTGGRPPAPPGGFAWLLRTRRSRAHARPSPSTGCAVEPRVGGSSAHSSPAAHPSVRC